MYAVQCTMHVVQYTMHAVQCTMYAVHSYGTWRAFFQGISICGLSYAIFAVVNGRVRWPVASGQWSVVGGQWPVVSGR